MLTEKTSAGFSVLADSAFPRNGIWLQGKVVRARKSNERGQSSDIPYSAWLAAVDILIEQAKPSESQSARFTVPLPADTHTRYRIIVTCAHLFNFRTRFVYIIEIRSVLKTMELVLNIGLMS